MLMRMMKQLLLFLLLACLGLFSSCRAPENRCPQVVVSIEPLRHMVEAVAGERCEVLALVPAGAAPETYEPTPRQLVAMDQAVIYFRVGTLGFERTRLEKIRENAPNVKMVSLSEGLTMLPHGHGEAAADGEDPHVWTSPLNVRLMAAKIHAALCEADSAGTAYYTRRLQAFEQSIDSLDAAIKLLLKDCPHRTFLIQHPALGYFARDYGLRQLSVEHEGKEAGTARVEQLIRTCRTEGVHTVFVQPEHSGRVANAIAKEVGAEVQEVNPLSYDWEAELLRIAKVLSDGN